MIYSAQILTPQTVKFILDLLQQIPLAVIAVFATLSFISIRKIQTDIKEIKAGFVKKENCENYRENNDSKLSDIKTDIETIKEKKVWHDLFETIIEGIKERLSRLETAKNMRK